MPKTLQITLNNSEYLSLSRAACERHVSMAELVREALGLSQTRPGQKSVRRKLEAIRAAAKHSYPTCDIREMLAEIEGKTGY
ncbi:MAG: hypothetical protein DMG92_13900 [Acidobacteria bacterium]|nr:MAG: hypothetical protein DMG92_13900 [Acidobacteriota bacterium]